MFFPDIAEYEDSDSELAKYTISRLHAIIDSALRFVELKEVSVIYHSTGLPEDVKSELIKILM